jgi:hypothetical protein
VTGEREVPTHSGGGAADAEDEVVADPSGPFPFTEGARSFALGYPTRDGYKAVILGGIFALVPILGLATNGYALQLARAAGRGRATPPEFDGVGALFVDGLKFLALSIVWYVVVLVGIVVAGIPVERGSALTGALAGGLVVGSLVYAFPAMLTALAVTDDFGAAFSPDYVLAWIATGQYLAAFLVSVVLALLLGVVVVLSFVTIVGVIFVAAWATFVLAAYWGYQYRRAVADGVVPPGGPEPVASGRRRRPPRRHRRLTLRDTVPSPGGRPRDPRR